MLIESVFESSEGLSYILFTTIFAGETIDQIGASTTDFLHAGVVLVCNVAGYRASFV